VDGTELSFTAHPVRELIATANFAYAHAYINEADAPLGAAKGERLPGSPRISAGVNADYTLPVTTLQPTIGTTVRYIGDRYASFDQSTSYPQYYLPEYTSVDLRAGLTLGSTKLQLYIHNLFDERGQLGLLFPQFGARVAIMQPRTIGIAATTRF